MKKEIEYLTDIFCENGHDKKTLQKIINSFEKKARGTNNNNNNTNKKQTVTISWVPKIKKEMQKFGFRVAFRTGPNLKNILCKNKDKLIPNSYPGVYELKCPCGSVYNGKIKKNIFSRSIEYQQQPTTQRNATEISTGYTPKLSP